MHIIRHPLLLCVATAVLWLFMMAIELLWFRSLSGGLVQLDYRPFGFSTDDVSDWLTALGPVGAQAMLVWHYLTFDLVFPALFGLTLASLTLSATRHIPRLSRHPYGVRATACVLWVLPYIFVDYLQNLVVAGMLTDPTGLDHTIVEVASGLNVAKFLFAAIGIAVLFLLWWRGARERVKL
ncbi:MAG: hypothetical protein K5872_17065 [Rhizobiaceae bacterium]|nr:hypothetical protein [Rhizobiaceae bacterium]MCV0407935.1 hypothetical protein [Rhizobiaceae bacterium]